MFLIIQYILKNMAPYLIKGKVYELSVGISISNSTHEITPETEDSCLEKKIHFLVIFMATRDNKIRRNMTGIATVSLLGKEKEGTEEGGDCCMKALV